MVGPHSHLQPQGRADDHNSASARVSPPGRPGAKVERVSMNYLEHFERRHDLCGGELVVKGTRVTVRTLLAGLSEGAKQEAILGDVQQPVPVAHRK